MSYILDALKKSEQERGHGSIPGVQTVHSSSINYQQQRRAIWPWFLVVAISINIAALFYFMQSRHGSETDTVNAPVGTTASVTLKTSQQLASAGNRETEPETEPVTPIINIPAMDTEPTAEPVAQHRAVPAAQKIVSLHDLPLNIRQNVPAMTFSAHVYSGNPRQRSLVINGRFMEEGDRVSDELVLVEITSGGAIFDFQGQRFSTSILSGWN